MRTWWSQRSVLAKIGLAIGAVLVGLMILGIIVGPRQDSATAPGATVASSATPTPSAEPTAPPSPTRTATPVVTPSPDPTARSVVGRFEDAARDLTDRDGNPTDGPGSIDLREVVVTFEGGDLVLSVRTEADIERPDPIDVEINYSWFLDTDGDMEPEYQVSLTNVASEGWSPVMIDLNTSESQEADNFPGTGSVSGDTATVRLRVGPIGNPATVAAFAASQRDDYTSTLATEAPQSFTDFAPDVQWPDEDAEWIEARH